GARAGRRGQGGAAWGKEGGPPRGAGAVRPLPDLPPPLAVLAVDRAGRAALSWREGPATTAGAAPRSPPRGRRGRRTPLPRPGGRIPALVFPRRADKITSRAQCPLRRNSGRAKARNQCSNSALTPA